MDRCRIELVTHDWARFAELLDLSYDVLYRDFDVSREGDWYHPANGSEFAVALDADDVLVGTARLLPLSGNLDRQVRQVAVAPETRGRGIGKALMVALEELAYREGGRELWLHARENAWGFYERLGYEAVSEVFVSELTGIPHRTMRRRLG